MVADVLRTAKLSEREFERVFAFGGGAPRTLGRDARGRLVVPLDPQNWSYRHVWQLMGVIYVLSLFITQRRYGVSGR